MAEAVRVNEEKAQGEGRRGSEPARGAGQPGYLKRALVAALEKWRGWVRFLHEVRVELSQVTWPTRNDVRGTTAVVLVTIAFFSAYFLLTDTVAGTVMRRILGMFSK
jgi:preprotein translocase subunit SecE